MILEHLTAGRFVGLGTNHEGERFIGELELAELLGGKGMQLQFSARAERNPAAIFHVECSVIAPNVAGGVSLFNFNTNTAFVAEHVWVPGKRPGEFLFRFGDVDQRDIFREEVRLELLAPNRLGYHYSWGLPGGDFAYRSGAIMDKVN